MDVLHFLTLYNAHIVLLCSFQHAVRTFARYSKPDGLFEVYPLRQH